MALTTIEQAIEDFRQGKFVIIVDDEDRENEGDLCIAAEKTTAQAINFMAVHGRGLICVPMLGSRLEELRIPMMVADESNTSSFGTAFTVSVEARRNVTTGISAFDRATTVAALINPASRAEDLVRPGHIFPLRAREGGVLVRAGQTEGSVDLARMAGMYPAAVICEIMSEDGTMARLPELERFGAEHGINIISVADLIQYRRHHERLITRIAEANLPTPFGDFTAIAYSNKLSSDHQVALVLGDMSGDEPVMVRVHSECLTGDVFHSLRCDCGQQLELAMRMIGAEGRGVVLYMRQEGRGIGLHNKLKAYSLQDAGYDTVEANQKLGFAPDLRDYGIGAQMLVDIGVRRMRLLTNNPMKVVGLEGYGLTIEQRVPLIVPPNPANERYLATKREKLGHILEV